MRGALHVAVAAAVTALLAAPAAAQDDFDELADLEAELDALDDSTTPAPTGGEGSSLLRSFKSFFASEVRVYPADRGGTQNDEQLLFEVQLELDMPLVGGLSAFVRPWYLVDMADQDLLRYEPLEGYFDYRAESWGIVVGQFIENWGIADAFNPLDVLNRRDLGTGPIDPITRGELGVRARAFLPGVDVIDEPSIAAYFIPLWRATEFPTAQNRFYFGGSGAAYRDDLTLEPEYAESLFAALRVEHTLNTPLFNADVQYIAARGPDRFPAVGLQLLPDSGPSLVPEYYGSWTFGGGVRAVPNAPWWSKLTLKGEVAYRLPYAFDEAPTQLPQDYVQLVGGFDRLVAPFLLPKDQLTITVEYAGEYGATDTQSLFRLFDSDVIFRLAWEAGDFSRTSLEARCVVDVATGEVITEAVAQRQLRFLRDDLRLELSGQYIRPTDARQSLFDFFPDASHVRARLQLDL